MRQAFLLPKPKRSEGQIIAKESGPLQIPADGLAPLLILEFAADNNIGITIQRTSCKDGNWLIVDFICKFRAEFFEEALHYINNNL